MFTIKINKLKVRTKIGILATERSKRQLLLVTLMFSYKVNSSQNTDNIANLKSYSGIKHFLKKYIEYSQCKSLEKLIVECSKALKKKFKINNVYLEIEKPETAKKYGCQSISVAK